MGYMGKVKLADIAPDHPLARPQITFGARRPPAPAGPPYKPGQAANIFVEWGNEGHTLSMKQKQWDAIKASQALTVKGPGYGYEGKTYQDWWAFEGGLEGELVITYGNDGGVGWNNSLSGADITEREPAAAPPRRKAKASK